MNLAVRVKTENLGHSDRHLKVVLNMGKHAGQPDEVALRNKEGAIDSGAAMAVCGEK